MVSKRIAAYRKKIPRQLLREIERLYAETGCKAVNNPGDPREMLKMVKERVQYLDNLERLLKKQIGSCKSILDGLWQ